MKNLKLLTLDGDYTPEEIIAYLDESIKEDEKINKQEK